MFTGIITAIGTVLSVERKGDWRVWIGAPWSCDKISLGSSICCSGVCLTVTECEADSFAVDVSEETLSRTTLHNWQKGTIINLERSLKMGDEMGGHIVSGHVDGVAVIEKMTAISDSYKIDISVPPRLAPFIAEKGSVALDGVSLTVNSVNENTFSVNIIEHTWQNTNLGNCVESSCVTREVDLRARDVSRLMQTTE